MFMSILTAIPIWVFPLFVGLLLLGLRASRDRVAPVLLIYALPLMGLMSFDRARHMPEAELALTALGAAYVFGAALGYSLQRRWIVGRTDRRVALRGEWLTMVTLLGLFGIGFAVGMADGMAPDLVQGRGFAVAFGLASGLMSGSLAGRALRVALTPVTPIREA